MCLRGDVEKRERVSFACVSSVFWPFILLIVRAHIRRVPINALYWIESIFVELQVHEFGPVPNDDLLVRPLDKDFASVSFRVVDIDDSA